VKLSPAALVLCFCLFPGGFYAQELFRWVDEKGTVHFTDNPLSIPEKYRGKAEKRTTPTSRRPLTPSTTGKTEKPDRASAPERFIIPFTRDENAVIVEATINGTHRVEFILDTGASVTTIPIVKARDLGIDPAKGDPVLLQGVGGVTVASAVEIQSLNVEVIKYSSSAFVPQPQSSQHVI